MDTQANVPGQPQAQTPVHPIHQEQALHERITQWVSDNPDNDPHSGTDLEVPKVEVPQEAKVEAPVQEAQPQEETVELDENTPFFEIEEGKKLSAKQLREGYLAKQDYHRNIQKVKAEEAAIQEKIREAEQKSRDEYVQRLSLQQEALQRFSGVKSFQEIQQLAQTDPSSAQQELLRSIAFNQQFQALEQEKQQALAKDKHEKELSREQQKLKTIEVLERDIDGFGKELYGQIIESMSKDYGVKDAAGIVDAGYIKVFHDAYKYRSLQKAKPEIEKKVVAVPKVIKPGSADKPNPASEASQEAAKQLRKTGDWRDAAQLYLSMQRKKR